MYGYRPMFWRWNSTYEVPLAPIGGAKITEWPPWAAYVIRVPWFSMMMFLRAHFGNEGESG
eukprot:3699032-Rhodomonas_salina.6